ncbi:hypothetical protein PtB15_2B304 [Puccinia triticina]|nr:hypothetical protein PtB15_2B304 [Puccinia triticina]
MQFVPLFICVIAVFISCSFQQASAQVTPPLGTPPPVTTPPVTPSPPGTSSGSEGDTTEVASVFQNLEKQGVGKTSANDKLPPPPAGAVSPQVVRQSFTNAVFGFLDEKVPEGATGTVFQLVIQYLEKVGQVNGGGSAGAAATTGQPAKAKASR